MSRIDPKAIEAARRLDGLSEGAYGDLFVSRGEKLLARALLTEHDRQERERCGRCHYRNENAECRMLGIYAHENGFCHHWQAKDGE